ncbi:unnamed protein product, partial [Staurois parvus]
METASNGSAVQGPMTHSGPGSSMRRRYRGPMTDYGPGSSNGRPVICQHPNDKMEPTSSVRRPESGTWQMCVAMETAAMGGRTGTHDTLWTGSSMEEAVQGTHDRLRAWQRQHEESVLGPWQITGLADDDEAAKVSASLLAPSAACGSGNRHVSRPVTE